MLHVDMTNSSFASALVTRVSSLRDSPQYSDLEILTPTRSFFAHKIVLSARSSDWGRGLDLSSSAVAVLNWEDFTDQTCGDILDYIYLDQNEFLLDKTFDDVRGIELLSAATFFSMNELVVRCEKFLEASKLRYPLEPESPAVLMKVALEASDLNLKKPDKRSILKINNVTKAKVKKASLEDIMHDHCYVDPPPPQKRRKLRRAKIKKATKEVEEEEYSLQMEVVRAREHNNNNQSDEIKMDSVDVVNTLIDIILDEVAKNKVAHMVEETNIETHLHLTLACGYAKAGDWQGVEKVMSECGSQGLGFDDGDYLELMFVMSEEQGAHR